MQDVHFTNKGTELRGYDCHGHTAIKGFEFGTEVFHFLIQYVIVM